MSRYSMVFFLVALSFVINAYGAMRCHGGLVWLSDAEGRDVVGVGTLKFNGQNSVRSKLVSVKTNELSELELEFTVDKHPDVRLGLRITESPARYELDFKLIAPSNFSSWGVQGTIRSAAGTSKSAVPQKYGIWNRCAANPKYAEPFETPNVKLKRIGNEKKALWYVIDGDENWCGGISEHFKFTEYEDGVRRCKVVFLKARADEEGWEVAARHAGRTVAVRLYTSKRNNIFDGTEPELLYSLSNVSDAPIKDVSFAVDVYDWDGSNVVSKIQSGTLIPGKRKTGLLKIPSMGRGLWFCEARAVPAGGKETFTRTTVAFLPPFEFKYRKDSIFGIINGTDRTFRAEKKEEMALLSRMGVHWLRGGRDWKLMEKYGIESIFQIKFSTKRGYNPDSEADRKMVSDCVDVLMAHDIKYAEMGNEIGHRGTAEIRRTLFSNYVTWLDAYRAERARRGAKFRIVYGTSSFRPELMQIMEEKGVWRKLDDYVIHPGRGYWTADMDSGGWRYLGLIRGTKRIFRETLGIKNPGFHLTEIYAKTLPNHVWADSYRQSAESILLSAALAMAETGIKTFCVHKLHEGISFDDNGVNHKNFEYHFGLLHRDNSPKPSFMGYVTAAEELDGAKFRYWIFRKTKNDKLRGLVYDTPRGPLVLLWDRTEGFKLTDHSHIKRKKGEPFFHWEPWYDHWRVKKPRSFKTSGGKVTVIDCIGRRKTMLPEDGHVTLQLDGSPRFVYGLDLAEFAGEVKAQESVHTAADIEEIDKQNRE